MLECTIDTSGYAHFMIDGKQEKYVPGLPPIYDPHVFEAMIAAYKDANEN